MPITDSQQSPEEERVAQLESELAAVRQRLAEAQSTIERLRGQYTRALEQLQLMRRRLFVTKSERGGNASEQLAFDKLLLEVQSLEKALDSAEGGEGSGPRGKRDKTDGRRHRTSPPVGRRDLSESTLPLERIEVLDPEREATSTRIGFETSYRLAYKRGGLFRVELAIALYKHKGKESDPSGSAALAIENEQAREEPTTSSDEPEGCGVGPDPVEAPQDPQAPLVRASRPRELIRRGLLAPSLIAHLLVGKYVMGVPFFRLEQRLALEGSPIDRGMMSRYAEDVGATVGAVVEAARQDALATAFCLSTDATSAAIQPTPLDDGSRQACRKGHFFVTLADCDHVFFDYQAKHNSKAVWDMFAGFSGHIQADAHSVYDALFRGTPPPGVESDLETGPAPTEVGCWSHLRRKFWEATVCKHCIGLEGLRQIDAIFDADRELVDLPPQKRAIQRQSRVRPRVDAFFAWAKAQHAERGLVAAALGYAARQELPLRRFLDDGRLKMTNNGAERALRVIAVGRKAWLFFGSDDHAHAAANLFSLFAGCKLHRLDPEAYLAELLRVFPYWPRDRYLELSPKYWAATRERLLDRELAAELGHITIPPPTTVQQPASD